MKRGRVTEIEAYRTELAARFAARRCRYCDAPAVVVIVGSEPVREVGITLKHATSDRNLCLFHAGLLSNQEAA